MKSWLKRRTGELVIGGVIALLMLAGVAVAQLPNTLNVSSAPSGTAPAIRAAGIDANISINLVPKGTGVVQVNGTSIVVGGGTTTSLTINPGPLAVTGTTNLTGPLFVQAGTSGILKGVGARVFHNVTDAPTTGTVIETLYTYPMPGNTLAANGQALTIETWAVTAGNANNKTLTMVFGATTIGTSTAAGFNGETMSMRCQVYRVSPTAQKARCNFQSFTSGTLTANQNTVITSSAPAETLSGAINILVRGTTPTAAADLTASATTIDWYPVGQ